MLSAEGGTPLQDTGMCAVSSEWSTMSAPPLAIPAAESEDAQRLRTSEIGAAALVHRDEDSIPLHGCN